MGLQHNGEMVAGVLYDPTRDELFAAEKAKGAYLNGARIRVSQTTRLAESLLATGFPSHKRHKNPNIHFYHQITLHSHGVRRAGYAALDLANVACGRFDGFWEFNLNPWDTAAGSLLVTEAGGEITSFVGAPFLLDSHEVLATNGKIGKDMRTLFADMFAGRNVSPIPTPEEFKKTRDEAAAAEQ
jgi:myo-inositol-1(or 4)-monophosphatase